jgi:predicted secreted hydrolase
LELALDLVPLLADQELRTSRSTQVTYWEGAVAVSGTKQGRPVKGQGYVELTGYAKPLNQKL